MERKIVATSVHTRGASKPVNASSRSDFERCALASGLVSRRQLDEAAALCTTTEKGPDEVETIDGRRLADMLIDNDTYWLIKNTPGVTGFLGGTKPTSLPEEEARNLIELSKAPPDSKPKAAIQFEQGETVRINEGPFKHFIGTVEDVNEERAKIKVMVSIFGRGTPVELDFLQVEKL